MSGSLILTAFAAGTASVVVVPLTVFAVELFCGIWPGTRHSRPSADLTARIAVLIPAHNEGAGIGDTLAALSDVTRASVTIVVVADNCADGTAAAARAAGAVVIERFDPNARGKGFALAFGRDFLANGLAAPDAVIVLDADCQLSPGSLDVLAASALATGRPAQAVNLITARLNAHPIVQISSFAMLVKNLYRQRGMQRLGGAASITGTGVAIPWPLFVTADLSSGSIVEDIAMGIGFNRQGKAPLLVEGAQVRSEPAALSDALVQRRRWEHGFLNTLRRSALPTLWHGLKRGSAAEVLLGLHLMVPPLALLLVLAFGALGFTGLLALIGAAAWPSLVLGCLVAVAFGLVFVAWLAGGHRFLTGSALLRAPLYILWKIPIYISFLKRPEAEWQRTPRESD